MKKNNFAQYLVIMFFTLISLVSLTSVSSSMMNKVSGNIVSNMQEKLVKDNLVNTELGEFIKVDKKTGKLREMSLDEIDKKFNGELKLTSKESQVDTNELKNYIENGIGNIFDSIGLKEGK